MPPARDHTLENVPGCQGVETSALVRANTTSGRNCARSAATCTPTLCIQPSVGVSDDALRAGACSASRCPPVLRGPPATREKSPTSARVQRLGRRPRTAPARSPRPTGRPPNAMAQGSVAPGARRRHSAPTTAYARRSACRSPRGERRAAPKRPPARSTPRPSGLRAARAPPGDALCGAATCAQPHRAAQAAERRHHRRSQSKRAALGAARDPPTPWRPNHGRGVPPPYTGLPNDARRREVRHDGAADGPRERAPKAAHIPPPRPGVRAALAARAAHLYWFLCELRPTPVPQPRLQRSLPNGMAGRAARQSE